jgi:hypothetical protein
MKILKYFTSGKWVSLYQDAWNLCLNKRKNLSDLESKEEARKNLGLDNDDNVTHFHDSRYLPKIESAKNEVLNILNERLEALEEELRNVKTFNDNKIVIQDIAPTNPTVNQVWICTKADELGVKVYNGNKWDYITRVGSVRLNIFKSDWVLNGNIYKLQKNVGKNFCSVCVYTQAGQTFKYVIGIDKIEVTSEGILTIESEEAFDGFAILYTTEQ